MIRAALLALALSSCVATTADLERIHLRMEASEARIGAQVDAVRESLDSECANVEAAREALDTVQAELAQTEADTARLAREASERAWTAFDRVVAAVIGLGGLGLTGYGAYKATNVKRDAARRRRSERV